MVGVFVRLIAQSSNATPNQVQFTDGKKSLLRSTEESLPEFSGWLVGVFVGLLAAERLTGSSSSPREKNCPVEEEADKVPYK